MSQHRSIGTQSLFGFGKKKEKTWREIEREEQIKVQQEVLARRKSGAWQQVGLFLRTFKVFCILTANCIEYAHILWHWFYLVFQSKVKPRSPTSACAGSAWKARQSLTLLEWSRIQEEGVMNFYLLFGIRSLDQNPEFSVLLSTSWITEIFGNWTPHLSAPQCDADNRAKFKAQREQEKLDNPEPKFGIIIPLAPFGMPEYDGGERFDLRVSPHTPRTSPIHTFFVCLSLMLNAVHQTLPQYYESCKVALMQLPYVDNGWVDEDADFFKNVGKLFGGGKKKNDEQEKWRQSWSIALVWL